MSTEVKSAAGKVRIDRRRGEAVDIRTFDFAGDEADVRSVPRSDFLAAVAAECDAVVIPRETLPAVTSRERGVFEFSTGARLSTWSDKSAGQARTEAAELLALAEYLDAHPPVDEAEVEALSALLMDTSPGGGWRDHAIALLATGRIEVKP